MEKNLKNITKTLEFKVAIIFAGSAFFISFITGLLNNVGISVLIKRILLSELIFFPMGYGIGYLLNQIIFVPHSSINAGSKFSTVDNKTSKVEISPEKEKEMANSSVPEPDYSQSSEEIVDEIKGVELEPEIKPENETEASTQSEEENRENENSDIDKIDIAEHLKRLKNLQSETLGNYIIVNDKKIINDPEIIARAVRTMMNRE